MTYNGKFTEHYKILLSLIRNTVWESNRIYIEFTFYIEFTWHSMSTLLNETSEEGSQIVFGG